MSVRIKFILPADEKQIEEAKYETSAQALPRQGEIVWFTEEAHLPAWRVEWVRHVFGRRGGQHAEDKLERIEPGRWQA